MLQYVFYEPIPVDELEAELRSFARLVAEQGYDTISRMVVVVRPTLRGEPFELRWGASDVPIEVCNFDNRLAYPKRKKSSPKRRSRNRVDGDE